MPKWRREFFAEAQASREGIRFGDLAVTQEEMIGRDVDRAAPTEGKVGNGDLHAASCERHLLLRAERIVS